MFQSSPKSYSNDQHYRNNNNNTLTNISFNSNNNNNNDHYSDKFNNEEEENDNNISIELLQKDENNNELEEEDNELEDNQNNNEEEEQEEEDNNSEELEDNNEEKLLNEQEEEELEQEEELKENNKKEKETSLPLLFPFLLQNYSTIFQKWNLPMISILLNQNFLKNSLIFNLINETNDFINYSNCKDLIIKKLEMIENLLDNNFIFNNLQKNLQKKLQNNLQNGGDNSCDKTLQNNLQNDGDNNGDKSLQNKIVKYNNFIEIILKMEIEFDFFVINLNEVTSFIHLIYTILIKIFPNEKIKKIPNLIYFFKKLKNLINEEENKLFCLIFVNFKNCKFILEIFNLINSIFLNLQQKFTILIIGEYSLQSCLQNNLQINSNIKIPNYLEYSINGNLNLIKEFILKNIPKKFLKFKKIYEEFTNLFLQTHFTIEKNGIIFCKVLPNSFEYALKLFNLKNKQNSTLQNLSQHNTQNNLQNNTHNLSQNNLQNNTLQTGLQLFKLINHFNFHQLISLFDIYHIKKLQNQNELIINQSTTTDNTNTQKKIYDTTDITINLDDFTIPEKFIIMSSYLASLKSNEWDNNIFNNKKIVNSKKKKRKITTTTKTTTNNTTKSLQKNKLQNKKQIFDIPRILHITNHIITNTLNYHYLLEFDFIKVIGNLIAKHVLIFNDKSGSKSGCGGGKSGYGNGGISGNYFIDGRGLTEEGKGFLVLNGQLMNEGLVKKVW
ncbi:hypothetical protein ABK040_001035 [Willaertia magna]